MPFGAEKPPVADENPFLVPDGPGGAELVDTLEGVPRPGEDDDVPPIEEAILAGYDEPERQN